MFSRKRLIRGIGIVLFALLVTGVAGYRPAKAFYERRKELERRKAAWTALEAKIVAEAQGFGQEVGVVIEDLTTHWKIVINQDKQFPAASLVKIPVMASCFYAQAENKMDLSKTFVLQDRFKTSGSGQLKNEPAGTQLSAEELIRLMISRSDNTAANILINSLGFEYLNTTFKSMGLKDTSIVRDMMDFESRSEGKENFTSPQDIAFLLEMLYARRLIDGTCDDKCMEILKEQKIRDRIPAKLPPLTCVAHKTGLENGICHDAGIVFGPRGDYLICVLVQHRYRTAYPAKKFIAQLALDVYDYYRDF